MLGLQSSSTIYFVSFHIPLNASTTDAACCNKKMHFVSFFLNTAGDSLIQFRPSPPPFFNDVIRNLPCIYLQVYIFPFFIIIFLEIMYLLHIWVTIKMDIIYLFVSKKGYLVTSLTYQLVDNQHLLQSTRQVNQWFRRVDYNIDEFAYDDGELTCRRSDHCYIVKEAEKSIRSLLGICCSKLQKLGDSISSIKQ